MSSLVIFFVVVIAVVGPQNVMSSISAKDIDVDKLLQLVQQQRINRVESSDSSDSSDSDDSDTSSDDVARSGRIGGDNIMDIISQVVNNKNNNKNHKNRNERASRNDERSQKYNNRDNKYDNPQRSNNIAQVLEQLFSSGFKEADSTWQPNKRAAKKRLTPNRLLGDVKGRSADDGLEDYSKIYILLNPQALQRSKDNKSSVNKMISRILSLSAPSSKKESAKPKQKRYKGFAVRGDIGRRRGSREYIEEHRKSNSVYAPKSSGEDKPKRSRNSGGGAGHTAIPYIRHRGENIYEKDN